MFLRVKYIFKKKKTNISTRGKAVDEFGMHTSAAHPIVGSLVNGSIRSSEEDKGLINLKLKTINIWKSDEFKKEQNLKKNK